MNTVPWDELKAENAQATSFAQAHFGAADLGHKARNRCLVRVAEKICRHPGGTLPTKLANPADYDAMDRLMNRPEVTHASILAAHVQRTRTLMEQCPGVVLVLHDSTVLDYSGLAIPELGPVGDGNGRGYLCHNSLAVDPQRREVLGLAHQILHRRVKAPPHERAKAKRERQSRESRLWSTAVEALGMPPATASWVDVADRGADVFEFLATEARLKRACLVRACSNRVCWIPNTTGDVKTKLMDHLRSLPAQGAHRKETIYDPESRQERQAKLAVVWAEMWLQPPQCRRGDYDNEAIQVWAVRVWEVDAPKGATPVEWFLLSNRPVLDVEWAWEQVTWYTCRYMVEEYHKAKKTGCQIEDLQFRSAQSLQPMIAMLSVVAVLLLNLRLACRRPDADQRLATELVAPIYEETLRKWRFKKSHAPLTVKEYYMALGRLGGHMNRKNDGPPGWLVLWRGWMKLDWMVAGAETTARRHRNRGET